MHVLRLVPSALLVATLALVTGCGRSAGGAGGEKSGEALQTAQQARTTATEAQTAVTALDARVVTAETSIADHEARLTAVEGDVSALETAQGLLDGRVTALEAGGGSGVDDGISVDDPAAAGFVVADNVTNVEDAFASVNGKIAAQTTRVDTLETNFSTNLAATVVQTVNDEIANGNINATVDVGFTPPGVDVDPRANGADNVPEYSASTTLAEAIMALRYANQVRYNAPAVNTRLADLNAGTIRSYVQEAINVLDKDLYDLIAGNVSPDLDTTNLPQDGTYDTVQLAVEDLYARVNDPGNDATLAAYITQQVTLGSQPYILGPSTTTSAGHLNDGVNSGLRGATGICQTDFAAEPTAHLCSLEEAQRALSAGSYAAALADVTTWTMGRTRAESCDGLLSDQLADTGTTLIVDLDYAGAVGTGHVIDTATTATCDTVYPVLCCR